MDLLQQHMDARGLSKRARREVLQSLQGGGSDWVRALSTGGASAAPRPPPATQRAAVVPVPRPAPKLPQPLPARPRLSRKPAACILEETGGYERERYVGRAPAVNAEARRREDQLLAEHGRKGLAEMRRMEAEQAAAKRQAQNSAAPSEADLATQLVGELEERAEFVERMAHVRHAGDAVRKVKLEMAQRVRDLEALGVPVPRARLREAQGSSDPNAITVCGA